MYTLARMGKMIIWVKLNRKMFAGPATSAIMLQRTIVPLMLSVF